MLCGCPSERCIIVGCLRRDLRQDYGNAEANDKDTGPGSMESVFWGEGCGSPDDWGPKDGPQVRGDLEDGCWGGNRTAAANWGTNQPINASFVTAMLKGDSGNHWPLKISVAGGKVELRRVVIRARQHSVKTPLPFTPT